MIIFKKGDIIEESDKRIKDCWEYETLFKINGIGNEQFWTIGYDKVNNLVYRKWGIIDGAVQEEKYTPIPKVHRTAFTQALQEINTEYNKRLRKGYVTNLNKQPMSQPMLSDKIKELEDLDKLEYPVYLSLKLDGMRIMARREGEEIIYRTRGNKLAKHLNKFFDEDIEKLLEFLPPGAEIDGEMYSEKVGFEKIISIIKKDVHREEKDDIEMKKNIIYCVFDINIINKPFDYRFYKLLDAYKNAFPAGYKTQIVLVNNMLAMNRKEIELFQKMAVSNGYEGTMIKKIFYGSPDIMSKKRWDNSLYVTKRSKNTLKLKEFEDEEGVVVDIINGGEKGSRDYELGKIVVQMNNGKLLKIIPSATREQRKEYLINKEKYIGKMYTYKFMGLGSNGRARIATGIRFREDELD